ncbi:hypothetical protein M5689_015071 [Euphorbia peplus]|nr:hypothetical protein M5689_015071 [Euphorbia peplus]
MKAKAVLWIALITVCWSGAMCHQTFQSFLRNPVEVKVFGEYGVYTKISGPNGGCLSSDTVEESRPILVSCRYEFWPQMYWKFETDGTFRSGSLCLTTSLNLDQGSFLKMRDCNVTPQNRTIWNLDDEVIMNSASGLALSVDGGYLLSNPTLETNLFFQPHFNYQILKCGWKNVKATT